MSEELKLPRLVRDFPGAEMKIKRDAATRSVTLSFSASSESPVDRWYGTEILAHTPEAIRMDRVNTGAVPLLFNHDWNDPIGMVDRASASGKRLMTDAHLFTTERAAEVQKMIDGGLRNISVGYQIHAVTEDVKTNTFTATDWEPLEISIVTVPADPSIGIGRGKDNEAIPVRIISDGQPATPVATIGVTMSEQQVAPATQTAEPQAGKTPAELEAARIQSIRNFVKANDLDGRTERGWIERGCDWNKVSEEFLEMKKLRTETLAQSPAYLDMGHKEVQRYSLMRAIRAATSKDWSKAGLELEANKELSKRLNRIPRSETAWFVPLDIMMRDMYPTQRRDMDAAGTSGSQYLISTSNQPGSFIDLLRASAVTLQMGITRMAGLIGNVTIPKMTAGNTAYWLADETTAITESQPTIGQIALHPHNVAALTELSHQLMQQSTPDAEALVLSSIARDIGLAIDVGVIRGSGNTGQPHGIVGTSGLGALASGSSFDAADAIEFQTDVAASNALLPGFGYVTTPAVAGLLMTRPELPTTGTTRLWQGNLLEGTMFGLPARASSQMSSATMLAGSWPTVVLAEWGVLELMTNPYSDFTRGLTAVRGWYTCDVGVRYPEAFSYGSSIT